MMIMIIVNVVGRVMFFRQWT